MTPVELATGAAGYTFECPCGKRSTFETVHPWTAVAQAVAVGWVLVVDVEICPGCAGDEA